MTPESFAASQFDVVIVGGGTAGLVLANRLTDSKHSPPLRVGVIDAGHYNPSGDPAIDIPYGANTYTGDPNAFTIGNPKYDWLMKSEPQASLDGNVIWYFRGKVLGGSSALHANAWQRSAKNEYDAWGKVFGNGDGWTWEGLMPYFARSERWTAPPSGEDALLPPASVHGKNGPINISYNTHLSDLDRPLTEAMVNLGYPLNDNPDDGDINYLPRDGIPRSVNPMEGKRSYATSAYYTPEVQARKNLCVLMGAVVSRLVWDKSNGKPRAVGVEFVSGGKKYIVNVGKEVILSAGSLKSPQILELSGVGNKSLLEKLGVPVTLDLPEVGENLMDHPVNISDFKVRDGVQTLDTLTLDEDFLAKHKKLYDTKHTGAFTYTPRITGAFPLQELISSETYQNMREDLEKTLDEMTLTPLQKAQYGELKKWLDEGKLGLVTPAMVPRGGMISSMEPNSAYISIIVFQGHGFSRGSVHIKSTNPEASPTISPEFLSLKWDLDVQIHASQFVRKWVQTEPAAGLITELHTPSAEVKEKDDWAKFVKSRLVSMSHPMGTTAMASRSLGGVVDERLKVYGLDNVRVVDAGVIPMTLGTPIQPAVYAIAEKVCPNIISTTALLKVPSKASDLIAEDLVKPGKF
ncbi:alcohol oxidase [Dendrothele bispora CBS 962.96]|uniref:Alcohol oxidase n=1 Tax=Dendrothele bispora (strain CBS 962.96) TaxID=1314807 RepID=A0A4S8L739_DENBC|nr:alcohol oxidase [Dendrothele bispora CBS 962.96]